MSSTLPESQAPRPCRGGVDVGVSECNWLITGDPRARQCCQRAMSPSHSYKGLPNISRLAGSFQFRVYWSPACLQTTQHESPLTDFTPGLCACLENMTHNYADETNPCLTRHGWSRSSQRVGMTTSPVQNFPAAPKPQRRLAPGLLVFRVAKKTPQTWAPRISSIPHGSPVKASTTVPSCSTWKATACDG